jgi:hypothetical protein
MKPTLTKGAIIILVVLVWGQLARPQGFVNLDFESPNTPLTPANFQVPAADAVPGWSVYTYDLVNPQSSVVYNSLSLGAAAVSIQGPGSLESILQGDYSVILQGSTAGPPGGAAIAQTGQIPQNAKSLVFFEGYFPGVHVSFGGQAIPLVQLGTTPNYSILGGDISAYAGQTGELRFTVPADSGAEIDNIQFSVLPVPEPGTLYVMAMGVLFASLRCWRK